MKQISEASRRVEKAIRHRRWSWCRLWNGFSDQPLWRLIAEQLNMPLHQVIAFAVRLDELANGAERRGEVDRFRADEFGVALGMSTEDAARIFQALERARWIEYAAVANFFSRNRDEEKEDQNARQQRSRNRKRVLAMLAKLDRMGRIGQVERLETEIGLKDLDDRQLTTLLTELNQLELSTVVPVTNVTSDPVTVTPDRITKFQDKTVDNSGYGAGIEEELAEGNVASDANDSQEAARRWIAIEGRRIALTRMPNENAGRIDTLLARWCAQNCDGDAGTLLTALVECDRLGSVGAVFHVAVTQACARYRRQKAARENPQPGLPLGAALKTAGGS
jgi:hypothetical protein